MPRGSPPVTLSLLRMGGALQKAGPVLVCAHPRFDVADKKGPWAGYYTAGLELVGRGFIWIQKERHPHATKTWASLDDCVGMLRKSGVLRVEVHLIAPPAGLPAAPMPKPRPSPQMRPVQPVELR